MNHDTSVVITLDYLDRNRTPKGGYNKKQVEALGLSWPLVSGWKNELVGKVLNAEQANAFEQASRGRPNNVRNEQKMRVSKCIEFLLKNASKLTASDIIRLRNIESKWKDLVK